MQAAQHILHWRPSPGLTVLTSNCHRLRAFASLPQIPRLYNVYKETGVIENFQQMLDNIFEPLFEVTADPSTHPQLHVLLKHVSGYWLPLAERGMAGQACGCRVLLQRRRGPLVSPLLHFPKPRPRLPPKLLLLTCDQPSSRSLKIQPV
mgnify:CR=1 FL=1